MTTKQITINVNNVEQGNVTKIAKAQAAAEAATEKVVEKMTATLVGTIYPAIAKETMDLAMKAVGRGDDIDNIVKSVSEFATKSAGNYFAQTTVDSNQERQISGEAQVSAHEAVKRVSGRVSEQGVATDTPQEEPPVRPVNPIRHPKECQEQRRAKESNPTKISILIAVIFAAATFITLMLCPLPVDYFVILSVIITLGVGCIVYLVSSIITTTIFGRKKRPEQDE